jgi:hypothetical protein
MMYSPVLDALINVAMALNEPGEMNREYARGQAELIVDACGLSMSGHAELVLMVITHQMRVRDFYAAMKGQTP